MPEISVIVPVYKVEAYINRCVDSVLAQSFTDFELILVDDGSPDNCGAICDEYAVKDERVHVIHQNNGGLSAARNAGIEWAFANSNSQWFSFIDSDDWVHPQYLEHLYHGVKETGMRISSCGYLKIAEYVTGDIITKSPVKIPVSDDYVREGNKIVAYAWGRLYDRSLWEHLRFPAGRLWEDVATIYRVLFSVNVIAQVDEKLYYYFINQDGIVNRTWRPNRMDEFVSYEEQLQFFSQNTTHTKVYQAIQNAYINAISYSYFMEQKSDLSPEEKEHYAAILRNKMRLALRKYRKTAGITFRDNTAVFDTAYPGLMQLYWIVQSRIKRFKGGE